VRGQEVAILAGVSVEYYTKVERGSPARLSESVLDAIAHALHLNEPEREHLLTSPDHPHLQVLVEESVAAEFKQEFTAAMGALATEEDAIRLASASEYGLASYLYSRDLTGSCAWLNGSNSAWSASAPASFPTPPRPSAG
jgi:transcriptional regulator with XRE-family HTH domain